jgi:O-methyltransferase
MTYNQLSSCPDMESEFLPIYERAKPFTMTSLERMYGLYKAIEYVVAHNISGDIVECGVWKGGSTIVCAETLKMLGDTSRTLWLYDTFEGMPPATDADIQYDGLSAAERFAKDSAASYSDWANASLEDVRANLLATNYPAANLRFIKGKVEETIPAEMPESIALLRLDTDWYESTAHEMAYLYPRLVKSGVLLIDDYGHWQGCRRAIDEYLATNRIPMLLNRLDYTARIGIKP